MNGMEILFKSMGINPLDFQTKVADAVGAINTRFDRIEAQIKEIKQLLAVEPNNIEVKEIGND